MKKTGSSLSPEKALTSETTFFNPGDTFTFYPSKRMGLPIPSTMPVQNLN